MTKCMDQLANHDATHELGYQKSLNNVNSYPIIVMMSNHFSMKFLQSFF